MSAARAAPTARTASSAPLPARPRASFGLIELTRLWRAPYLLADDRAAIGELATPARTIPAGRDLVREGERTDTVHLIVEGWAYRYKTTRLGTRQIVGLLLPGDIANLDSVMFDTLDYGIRSFGAARVVGVPRLRLAELAAERGTVGRALTWLAVCENAIGSEGALCLGRLDARQRLAHLFCEIAARLGAGAAPVTRFELPMTQEQLGDTLGLTAVHLNRMMQQLRGEGLIRTLGRRLVIADAAGLREAGEFNPRYLHADPGAGASLRPPA